MLNLTIKGFVLLRTNPNTTIKNSIQINKTGKTLRDSDSTVTHTTQMIILHQNDLWALSTQLKSEDQAGPFVISL